jgi:hypothetical protein
MAVYNEVMVGRYVRFLQKFLGIKGRQPAPLTFSGELAATWGLFHGNENRYLEGWNQFGFSTALAASAGNANAFQLRNPAGSNVIGVVTKLKLGATGTATTMITSLGVAAANLTNPLAMTNARFDPRGNPTPSLLFSTQQVAAPTDLANQIDRTNLGIAAGVSGVVDVIVTDTQEIPILPGDGIRIRNTVVNVEGEMAIWWRERVLEESELT